MAINRYRAVIADRVGAEPPKCLYIGPDAAKADDAFSKAAADKDNEFVHLLVYPTPARQSFPAENDRATRSAQDRKAEEDKRLAREAKDTADRLEAEAKTAKEKSAQAQAKLATNDKPKSK